MSSPSSNSVAERYRITRRVADIPERLRPRELFEEHGAEHVSDAALIAIILRSGVKGNSVVDLAESLLAQYGTLSAMARASVEELADVHGMGKVKAQVLKASLELAHRIAQESPGTQPTVQTPEDAAKLLRERSRSREEEAFWVLLLDTKYRLQRKPVEITKGILDASLVHPREAFREAVRAASAAVVFVHNHPSGDPSPSPEDIRITKRLVEAGRIVDIEVLDHVIVGKSTKDQPDDFYSLRESGLVEF